mmetsp:Transcript_64406/g.147542  ORF Transcript_64406/g.147542 Transcript_64406/m.147542 type:complete len:384 (-) Transcript_64406:47-1198(-)
MLPRAPLLAVLLAARALTASAFSPPADLAILGGSRLGALSALGRSVHGGTAGRRDAPNRGSLVMMHHESRRSVLRSGLLVPFAGTAAALWRPEVAGAAVRAVDLDLEPNGVVAVGAYWRPSGGLLVPVISFGTYNTPVNATQAAVEAALAAGVWGVDTAAAYGNEAQVGSAIRAAGKAGKVAVTTTLSATMACLTATLISFIFEKSFDIGIALNGILAGLVGITANCSVVDPWHAVLIGFISAWVYYGSRRLLFFLKIDDPLDAFPIHGCCGYWGLLATGIFCTDENVQYAAYPNVNTACASGEQFGVQAVGGLVIFIWSFAISGLVFLAMKFTIGVRVSEEVEDQGLDFSEHGLDFIDVDAKPAAQVIVVGQGAGDNKVAPL